MHQDEPRSRFMVDGTGKPVRVVNNPISYDTRFYDGSNSHQQQYARTRPGYELVFIFL